MKAQVLDGYRGPEAFELREVADPHAAPDQVRVRVAVAAVNPLDWKIRSGALASALETRFPAVLGNEVAGVVDEVGAELVVIGLRRRSPVGKMLMGSTSQRVLLDAPCPVLAVQHD